MPTQLSSTEENYLKAIFKLSIATNESVSTNAIAAMMDTSAASVTDMLKRLTEKGYTLYEKYKGVRLSDDGQNIATMLVRKHRLWECFMVDKLNFSWDEVHPIAEQLEHIQSEELINRLEHFLGFPKFDPHGDPIPDKDGKFAYQQQIPLSDLKKGQKAVVVGVREHSPTFLKYLEQLNLILGTNLEILDIVEYDGSMHLNINEDTTQVVTLKVGQNVYVQLQ